MRNLTIIVALLSFFSTRAGHLVGGEITWECTTNGSFIFETVLYQECGTGSAPVPPSLVLTWPQGYITCVRIGGVQISPSCTGPGAVSCGTTARTKGAIRRYIYRSPPISLSGTPPPLGWEFSFVECCRQIGLENGAAGNFYLRSVMYGSSSQCQKDSPHFAESASHIISGDSITLATGAASNNSTDSLYIDFASPRINSVSSVGFSPNFSYSQPFPNTNTNASNGLTSINHSTGIIKTHVHAGTSGLYCYGIVIEQWENSVLLSRIYRDYVAMYSATAAQQVVPSFQIVNSSHAVSRVDQETYNLDVSMGDTILIDIEATSTQMRLDTTLADIIATGRGYAFDAPFLGASNYSQKATLTPVSPQMSLTSSVSNNVRLKWVIGREHVLNGNKRHALYVKFSNDVCPYPAITNMVFMIKVSGAPSIGRDTIGACFGDSVELSGITRSGSFLWTSADATFSSQMPNPKIRADSSQYYYLSDPHNPGFLEVVYVEVDTLLPVTLGFNGKELAMVNPNLVASRTWFYNEIPFAYPYDTLSRFSGGLYQASVVKGGCRKFTDTLALLNGTNLAVTTMGNGQYVGNEIASIGSLGIDFKVNKNIDLRSLTIPGLVNLNGQINQYDLNVKIYDDLQVEVYNQSVSLAAPFKELLRLPLNFSLVASKVYTLALTGDSGYAFSIFENFTLPATPFNIGFTVVRAVEGFSFSMPTTTSNYLLPISLGTNKGLNVKHPKGYEFSLFPNPTKDRVEIRGLISVAEKVELINVNGEVLRSMAVQATTKPLILNCANVPPGIYLVRVYLHNGAAVSHKFLIE